MGIISQKLRNSAKGQDCAFQIPQYCHPNNETVVLCHIRDEAKGAGNKANDWSAAFGCHRCHKAIDEHWLPKEEELFFSLRAMQRTQANWIERGLIVIAGDTGKTRPKRKSKWPSKTLQSRGFAKPHHGERHDD